MNNFQTFNHPEFGEVRMMLRGENDEPWFVGKDVAQILGYKRTADALADHVEEEDKGVGVLPTPGGNQPIIIINESGLYSLIFASKLESARLFKHWVTSEVLPLIRRTGGYIPLGDNESAESAAQKTIEILTRTLKERDQRIAQQQKAIDRQGMELQTQAAALHEQSQIMAHQHRQLVAQRPMVNFASAITASEGSILIRDLAKLLTQNGIRIGQNRMFRWLRRHGYIFQNGTRPIQRWVEAGIFESEVALVHRKGGAARERLTTRVTGYGQKYFIEGFLRGIFAI